MSHLLRTGTIILFVLCLHAAKGQTSDPVADSLLRDLSKAREDTAKVNLYIELGYTYNAYDPKKALEFGLQGITLSKKLDFTSGTAELYYIVSDALLNQETMKKQKPCLMNRRISIRLQAICLSLVK